MPKPKIRPPKTSTATEHSTPFKTSTATEQPPKTSTATEHCCWSGSLTGLPKSTSKLQASASEDGLFPGDNELEKIEKLLLWMTEDFQPSIQVDDIRYAALEAMMKCNQIASGAALGLLHTASISKLTQIIDIMMLHKDGSPKDTDATLKFMRRCAGIREELIAGRHLPQCASSKDNATERVELDEKDVSLCYQRLGRDLITHDLRSHQHNDKRYHLRNNFEGDTQLSGFQRSFVDHMLRKLLGEKKVALRIWQHGLPSVADPWHNALLDIRMLQSCMLECLQWYIALANDIVVHQTQPEFDVQLSLGSKEEEEQQRQQTRREALQKARDALRHGAILAKQREQKKRTYDDMNVAELKILAEFETGRAQKAKQDVIVPRMRHFRCHVVG